jgi:predicted tellurium resistance membrane protein TerC
MEAFLSIENLLNILVLTGLETVLGIDNVIFIALIIQPLAINLRQKARVIGLSLALILRIIMLFGATWIMTLTKPLIVLFDYPISGRDILLIAGGLFLVVKTIHEFKEMKEEKESPHVVKPQGTFSKIIGEIIFIDLILSFDSIITAVGMTTNLTIIIAAVIISMIIMLVASKTVGEFIYKHPRVKVIALSFILLVGIFLIGNGFNIDIPKGYLYFAMLFSIFIEIMNITLLDKKSKQI